MLSYLLIAVIVALSVSFFCSILESSVLSLRPADVARLRQRSPDLGALWERLRKNIDQPIAAILILNTVANVVGATIAGAEFDELISGRGYDDSRRWLLRAAFSFGIALLIIQWGEILPKTLGVRYRQFVAAHAGRWLTLAVQVLRPVMWLTRTLNRPFESTKAGASGNTVDEIRALVSYASFARLIDRRQERIMTKTVQLDEMTVGRIMVPRTEVSALEAEAPVSDLLAMVRRTGFSRIPVYRGGIDNIVGLVLAKDILMALHDGTLASDDLATRPVDGFLAKPLFVPESASVASMMAKAAEQKAHMVFVIDEHGGFAGLVTLEDALEELFGEIVDEHDRGGEVWIEESAPGRWLVRGLCPIEDVSRATGVDLTSPEDDYSTLSGLLMLQSGRIPQKGDVVRHAGLQFKILDASPTRPKKVEITRKG